MFWGIWAGVRALWRRRGTVSPRLRLRQLLDEKSSEIRAAEIEVQRWESPIGMPLTKLERVWLYERALTINGKVIPLTGVRAQAVSFGDVSTESSPTLTRAAIGGCLFGWPGAFLSLFLPKRRVSDARRTVLQLWVDGYEEVVTFKPYHDTVVFELAAMINNAAKDAPQLIAHREQFLREAKLDLMKTRADTPEIAVARSQIAAKKRGKMEHRTHGGADEPEENS